MKTGNSHKNHWDYDIPYLNFKNVPYKHLYRALFFWNGFFIKTFAIVAWRKDNHCTIAKLRHNILGLTITNFYKVCEKTLHWRLIEKSSLGLILSIRHEINPKRFFFILLRHSKITISLISYLTTKFFVKYFTFRVQECGDFFNIREIWFVHPSRKKTGMKKHQFLNFIIYISGLAYKFFCWF